MTEPLEWPPRFRRIDANILMKFPKNIKSLATIDNRLFATLEDGMVIDCTDLLGEAKQ